MHVCAVLDLILFVVQVGELVGKTKLAWVEAKECSEWIFLSGSKLCLWSKPENMLIHAAKWPSSTSSSSAEAAQATAQFSSSTRSNSGYSFSYGKRRRRRLCSSGSSGISSCLRHCSTSLVPSSKTNRDRRERGRERGRSEKGGWETARELETTRTSALRQWTTAHDNWMQA